ncbi:hypothetical protein GCM10009111_25910 [Colwellia asteriadis]|uniref:Uncharacterized protein n=1 Tax=Colwellia asteriadis TaxID=517723 RepID=A0ABN1L922_9GAMM
MTVLCVFSKHTTLFSFKIKQTNIFYKKRVDGKKEKQSNSARLNGEAK